MTFAEDAIYTSAETTDVEGNNFRVLYLTPVLRNAKATDVYVHLRTVQPTENLNGYAPARIGSTFSLHHAVPIVDRRGTRIPARQTEFPIQTSLLPGSCGKYFFVEITKVTTDGRPNSTNIDSSVAIGNPSRVTVFIDHCLVSNNGQTDDGGGPGTTSRTLIQAGRGQAFTTGSHKPGYTLTSVDVVFERIEVEDIFRKNDPQLAVTIRNDSSGLPGTTVGKLTLPSTSPATFDSNDLNEDQTFTFSAPGKGIKLKPSSTYFVVFEAVGSRLTDVTFRSVRSNAENAGGAAGFSIANEGAEYVWYADPQHWTPRGNSLQISVNGEPNPITDLVQMSSPTREVAEFGNHKANGGVRVSVEIGDGMSLKGSARTINYTVGGSATRGNGADDPKDFYIEGCMSSSCSVTLPANRYSVPITIYVNDDGIDEDDETIVLTLQDGSGYTLNNARKTTTVTIADDDTRGLQFHRRWADVGEGSSETLTLRLSSQPTAAVTVKIASNNPDVTVSPTSLTFNPSGSNLWSRARNVTVSAAQDDDAVDDTATLTYTTSGGDYGGANALSIARPVSVDDDDTADPIAPRLPRISVTGGAAVTEGGAASFTVNADPAPTARLTVNVEVVEPPGQDFVAASQEGVRTVALNAGAASATFTVPTVDDSADEDDGAVRVFVNDGAGYVAGQGAAVTVLDNDDPIPAAFFRFASSDTPEHGGTQAVRVELDYPAPSAGLTLRYSLSGTARAGSSNDYTIQNSGTLSIPGGDRSADIAVVINDDSAIENAETVILTLTGGTGYTVDSQGARPSVHTVTIEDNDSTSAAFAVSSSSVDEDVGTHNVTVNLSQAAPTGGLTLTYSVAGTATAGSGNDYTIQNPGTVSIAAGSSSADIAVTIIDDSAFENAETVILTLTGGTGYTLGSTTTHTLTINTSDQAPISARLSFVGGSPLPEGGDLYFNLLFSRALGINETVTLPLTIGGTATLGTDYRLSCRLYEDAVFYTCNGFNGNNPTITFDGAVLQGDRRPVGPLHLEVLEDNTSESNETVVLSLGGGPALTITITDAPSSVAVEFLRSAYSVNESALVFQPILSVTPANGRDLTIPLIYTDTSATGGADYTRVGQLVLEANGQTRQSMDIPILEDTVYEGDETFTVAIDTANLPAGVTAGSITAATVTIVDDDPSPGTPSASFASGASSAAESAGTHNVTVNLSPAAPSGGLTLGYGVTGTATAGSGNDFTIQGSGSLSIAAGATSATIPVAINDDGTTESAETVILTLTGGTGYTVGTPSVHTLTITDNDGTGQATLSLSGPAGADEGDSGTSDRYFTVSLSSAPSRFVSWQLCFSGSATIDASGGGTIPAGADYQAISGQTPINLSGRSPACTDRVFRPSSSLANTDLGVRIKGDTESESDETVTVTLRIDDGPDDVVLGTSVATYTIRDDDATSQPAGSFASGSSSAAENAGTRNVRVNLSPAAPSGGLTLSYGVTGTATTGSDFTIRNSGRLRVAAEATSAVIPVAIIDDATREYAETVILTLTGGTGYTLGSTTTHTLTITDNDGDDIPAATVSVSDAQGYKACESITFTISVNRAIDAEFEPNGVGISIRTRESDPVSAEEGTDFHAEAETFQFNPGDNLHKKFRVRLIESPNEGEEPKTFEVVLHDVAGAEIGDGVAVGTILDDFPIAGCGSSLAHAPLVPSSSNPLREGLVRIVNPSAQGGEVRIVAIDDAGWRRDPVTLGIGAGASAQFTSRDLEWGNAATGLIGAAGPGTGDWRLEIASDLDVEMLPYARTADGTLSAMGDVVAAEDNVHRVALFNPADSPEAASRLRLTNRGARALRADITGVDDAGASPGGIVSVEIAARASVLLTAAELEAGGSNLLGALGDGEGQWRLDIASDGDLAVMNLVETSDGHLTNLSNATATSVPAREAHVVDSFPSSSDISNEQGVVRIVNSTESPASIRIEPNDSTGWRYAPLTLTLGAGEAANLGTWDLELGNAAKGLSGNAGPGTGGAWRLAISSDGDIEVLNYTRTANGLLKVPPGDAATEDKLR